MRQIFRLRSLGKGIICAFVLKASLLAAAELPKEPEKLAPAEAVNVVPCADHLMTWSSLLNSAEKPATADDAVPFGPIAAEHLATGLKVGFSEV